MSHLIYMTTFYKIKLRKHQQKHQKLWNLSFQLWKNMAIVEIIYFKICWYVYHFRCKRQYNNIHKCFKYRIVNFEAYWYLWGTININDKVYS